jgi:molybdate transport system ATP-binding protein
MVFQQYALFPHLTACENVEFPMRPASKARALELLRRVRLEDHADRYPHQLSGGQQQRVAIARAIAANARVLLLDEPFSALDRPIRDALHQDLRALQEETGLVIVYVTHDLEDALVAGDRLALLDHGRIVQVAPARTIFSAPRNRSVLEILGVPNLLDGELIDGKLDWKGLPIELPPMTPQRRGEGMALSGYLPAEEVLLGDGSGLDRLPNLFPCQVRRVLAAGRSHRIVVELSNGGLIEALLRSPSSPPRVGDSLYVSLPPHAIVLTTE